MQQQQDYRKKLDEQAAEERRHSRVDYSKIAFMTKQPYTNRIVDGPLTLADKAAHRQFVDGAKSRGLYVWMASVTIVDGRACATGPHIIDWDSMEAAEAKPVTTELKCHNCGKTCSSTSGLTLHLKMCSGAPEPVSLKCDVCGKTCSSTSGLTLHKKHAHGG